MSDYPADTLIFTDSPPAHKITAHPWGLWMVAALLGLMDALLFLVLIGRG